MHALIKRILTGPNKELAARGDTAVLQLAHFTRYGVMVGVVCAMSGKTLFVEPFYGGSHRQLVDLLQHSFGGDIYTLPPTKWNWRMRISALHFSDVIPNGKDYDVLFASSVLNLCELVALRPDLAKSYKLYYFHENQLVYPVKKKQERDFQHGYSQILSCLVANKIIFNSHYNMDSFLNSIQSFMSIVPDHRPKHLHEIIVPKCVVLYFPIQMLITINDKSIGSCKEADDTEDVKCNDFREDEVEASRSELATGFPQDEMTLHILWPHRWEHDKGPEVFCSVLTKLLDAELSFSVSILGSHTNDIPDCLQKMISRLGSKLLHKGHLPLHQYMEVLNNAHVVVSTANHEFFGVAMLEAVFCGCYPLCPNQLVYPEIYPSECLYNTEQQLFKRLKYMCQHPTVARDANIRSLMCAEQFSWIHLRKLYEDLFKVT